MSSADSTRFIIQTIVNIIVCNYAKGRFQKMAQTGKHNWKSLVFFLLFTVVLLGANQIIYFMFKDRNLYEELEVSRRMSGAEITEYANDIKIKIMSMNMDMNTRLEKVNQLQAMVQVLTHPATRLTYDSFGEIDNQYAWAFKSEGYLLSSVIGAGIFYLIFTIMQMVSKKRTQLQQAVKMQILIMIMFYLWQIHIIMHTEDRFNQHTDLLDHVYTAFPMFERREYIKILLIPSMNVIHFFVRFFMYNQSERKLVRLGKNPYLRNQTQEVRGALGNTEVDQHIEDRLQASVTDMRRKSPALVNVFLSWRRCVQLLLFLEGESIMADIEVNRILKYFLIK